jgi:S-DNA-T family DNA segregation ATPase FtsK/SpoIIIE
MGWTKVSIRRKAEVFGLLVVTILLFVLLSLATHSFNDDRWFAAGENEVWTADYHIGNSAGLFGGWVAFVLIGALGVSSLGLVAVGTLFGLRQLFNRKFTVLLRRTEIIFAAVFTLGVLINLPSAAKGTVFDPYSLSISGSIGYAFSGWLSGLFGFWGAGIILICLLAGTAYLFLPWKKYLAGLSIPKFELAKKTKIKQQTRIKQTGAVARWSELWWKIKQVLNRFGRVVMPAPETSDSAEIPAESTAPDYLRSSEQEPEIQSAPEAEPPPAKTAEEKPSPTRRVKMVRPKRLEVGDYTYPTLDLLAPPSARSSAQRKLMVDEAAAGADALRNALSTFDVRIAGDAIEVFPGPVITRYEFQPAPGVKVNQIIGLADDLALVLRAQRVRIVAPVPGKAAVGIEVPNSEAEEVGIREILQSKAFAESEYRLPLALGRDIGGKPFITDLAGMPHLLIAGATGSGKSVSINVIITSLLFRLHPRELRFLFVDPKMLELSIYQGIPHLEKNVVSRPRAAERLFDDCVREMEERYRILAGAGVRNVTDYNAKASDEQKLPYVVIIVDELADLMMSPSANKIENLITRLAQMARAVGIHLILATQRPSVDVITGLIKANFSSRIAFQVASKVDSRTIIDGNGAEKLLGRGDMLFLSPGTHEPVRLHGAFISGGETERLVEFLKAQVIEAPKIKSFDENEARKGAEELDPEDMVLRQAAEVVVRHKQGSVSLLQRRLGVGYQRAARLIDRLEEAGVVGPYDGSKAREVLVTKEDLAEKFGAVSAAEN